MKARRNSLPRAQYNHTRISANDVQFANTVILLKLLQFLNKLYHRFIRLIKSLPVYLFDKLFQFSTYISQ